MRGKRYRQVPWAMSGILPLIFLLLFFCYPLMVILRTSFFGSETSPIDPVVAVVPDPYLWRVLGFSAWQALLSTALTLVVGLPAAYLFARYNWRGKTLLGALATVPFVLPTVVVAAAFGALLGPNGALNRGLQDLLGLPTPPIRLQGTLWFILLAHVFYNFTVVLRIVSGMWATLSRTLEEAAAVLGANRWRIWWEVTFPLLLSAIGAAALLIYIFSFTAFGTVLIL